MIKKGGDITMLRLIGLIVVIGWLLGFLFEIGGSAIHLLLVIAAISFIVDFIRGRA